MAVTTRDLKEWGITKTLDDMMCDELFGPEKTMTDDLLTRLRKWHAANLPEEGSEYDAMDIKDIVPEVIDRLEELEFTILFKVNRVKSEEIPDSEIHGLPIMCDGSRIFPLLGKEYVLFATRAALRENKHER